MFRRAALLAIATLSAALVPSLQANTYCDGLKSAYPSQFFCDDFDRYCIAPPPAPEQCGAGAIADPAALHQTWVYTAVDPGNKGYRMGIEDSTLVLNSPPFGGKTPNGGDEGGHLGQSSADLLPGIHAVIGPQYNQAMAGSTEDTSIFLHFYMASKTADAASLSGSIGYIELAFDTAVAPMDYVMVGQQESEGCNSCFFMCPGPNYSVHVPWPTVCQSYQPRTTNPGRCPAAQTNVRPVFAVGVNALLDNSPCHCGEANQKPTVNNLAMYDGLKWGILNKPPYSLYITQGKFELGDKVDTVAVRIWATTIDVEHTAKHGTTWKTSKAVGIPRQYLGGFNKIRAGGGAGCELYNGAYNCSGQTKPIRMGEFRCDGRGYQHSGATYVSFDGVALYGGFGGISNPIAGACCKNDATCTEMLKDDCLAIDGRFRGSNTRCATVSPPCCPSPYADDDVDGDIDQEDFAALQRCLTTGSNAPFGIPAGCACFDRNGDNEIDATDMQLFLNCAAGPEIDGTPIGCAPY